jgi:hypothetical protein
LQQLKDRVRGSLFVFTGPVVLWAQVFFRSAVFAKFLQGPKNFFIRKPMDDSHDSKKNAQKMMLGFIVRRCAADIGHAPTPDEFAAWANAQIDNGRRYCLFGKPISASAARIMFRQPGRLVTVRQERFASNRKVNGR